MSNVRNPLEGTLWGSLTPGTLVNFVPTGEASGYCSSIVVSVTHDNVVVYWDQWESHWGFLEVPRGRRIAHDWIVIRPEER